MVRGINYRGSTLIEDSEYGVFNPDMQGSTCFGIDWGKIYHAGEDWYRMDGATTFQAVRHRGGGWAGALHGAQLPGTA